MSTSGLLTSVLFGSQNQFDERERAMFNGIEMFNGYRMEA